jgi:hypothetical protein
MNGNAVQWLEVAMHADDRDGGMATMADAHREWHRNAGVPMGTPGCPQDACHPADDYDESDDEAAAWFARANQLRAKDGLEALEIPKELQPAYRCSSGVDLAAWRFGRAARDAALAEAQADWPF